MIKKEKNNFRNYFEMLMLTGQKEKDELMKEMKMQKQLLQSIHIEMFSTSKKRFKLSMVNTRKRSLVRGGSRTKRTCQQYQKGENCKNFEFTIE